MSSFLYCLCVAGPILCTVDIAFLLYQNINLSTCMYLSGYPHSHIRQHPHQNRCPDFSMSTLRGSAVPVVNLMYYTRVLHFSAVVIVCNVLKNKIAI